MEVTVEAEQLVEIPEVKSEQTLAGYIEQLNSQLSQVNRFIYSAQVDGREITEELNQQKCEQFEELVVDVRSFEEMTVESIGELGKYCQNFLASLPEVVNNWPDKEAARKDEFRQQVLEACEMAGEVLEAIDSLLAVANVESEELLERVKKLESELREAGRSELKNLLKENCRDFFIDLLEALETILSDLEAREKKVAEQIDTLQEKVSLLLDELPDLIQTLQEGEEVEGFEEIENQVENISQITTIISVFDKAGLVKQNFTPEEQDKLIEIHSQLTTGFDELQEAIENKDLIMICDIIEYEILPYLETIEELFGSISTDE